MAYKNFSDLNAALESSRVSARQQLCQRLINLSSQISSLLATLPQEWGDAYANVQVMKYASDGTPSDVTESSFPDNITVPNSIISKYSGQLNSLIEDINSLAQQYQDIDVHPTLTSFKGVLSDENAGDSPYYGKICIPVPNSHIAVINLNTSPMSVQIRSTAPDDALFLGDATGFYSTNNLYGQAVYSYNDISGGPRVAFVQWFPDPGDSSKTFIAVSVMVADDPSATHEGYYGSFDSATTTPGYTSMSGAGFRASGPYREPTVTFAGNPFEILGLCDGSDLQEALSDLDS
jgi:hypothetical protein